MDFHEVTIPITTIVPGEPSGDGNAGEDYKQAVDIVSPLFEKALEENPEFSRTILDQTAADIGTWMNPKVGKAQNKPVNPEGLQVMERIAACVAQGAAKKEMKYPFNLAKMEVTYNLPEAKYLHVVSQALGDYAHYQNLVLKKPEEAQKILFNRFIMGWHMSRDRVFPYFVLAGFDIQISSCQGLGNPDGLYAKWPGHKGQVEKVKAYISAANDVKSFFNSKSKFLFSNFARVDAPPNPGDLFNVVQNDKDPCWRIQGIFALGMLKFSPALIKSEHYEGDAQTLRRLLDEKLKNGTEEEKSAARAADKYTKEDYEHQGNKNIAY
jgi:hypothetical protein